MNRLLREPQEKITFAKHKESLTNEVNQGRISRETLEQIERLAEANLFRANIISKALIEDLQSVGAKSLAEMDQHFTTNILVPIQRLFELYPEDHTQIFKLLRSVPGEQRGDVVKNLDIRLHTVQPPSGGQKYQN